MSREKIKQTKMKNVFKQFLLFFIGGALFASCHSADSATTKVSDGKTANTVVAEQMNYPYTIDHPDYWETGSQQNTMNALSSLKAWENNNMDESMKYFADSVHAQFDGFDKTVPKDSLRKMITPGPTLKNHSIKMQDWESVISKDKKDEYVTLWYRQFEENTNGKKDSVDVINDLKMKDGKIIGLDEYRRKLN
jgi:hypothetical protein